jgi:hypothetical protein
VSYRVSFSPFGLHAKRSEYAGATTTVLIDRHRSALADDSADVLSLSIRAAVYAQFSQTGPVLKAAAAAAGIQPAQIATGGPLATGGGQIPSEQVANQLIGEGSPYRMNFQAADPTVAQIPTLSIYAQAPTPVLAEQMANGAYSGLRDYLRVSEQTEHVRPVNQIIVRQLAPAQGAVIASSVSKAISALAALGIFVVLCMLIIAVPGLRRMWRATALEEQASAPPAAPAAPGGEQSSGECADEPGYASDDQSVPASLNGVVHDEDLEHRVVQR